MAKPHVTKATTTTRSQISHKRSGFSPSYVEAYNDTFLSSMKHSATAPKAIADFRKAQSIVSAKLCRSAAEQLRMLGF